MPTFAELSRELARAGYDSHRDLGLESVREVR